jgi:hypothetical protein
MSWLGFFRRINRKHWFVCNNCMTLTGHDTVNSVFYYRGLPEVYLGRPLMKCPRCCSTNTRRFQDIKNEGAESAIWGLEQIVKKYPRSRFEVKSGAVVKKVI